MLTFDKSRMIIKPNHTLTEYIIAVNANTTTYEKLCKHLKITFAEARAIYDRIYKLPIDDIAEIKKLQYSEYKWHRLEEV